MFGELVYKSFINYFKKFFLRFFVVDRMLIVLKTISRLETCSYQSFIVLVFSISGFLISLFYVQILWVA